MQDNVFIDKCLEAFKDLKEVELIAILKTDKVGDTVENHMGIEFDLKKYYVLYQTISKETGGNSVAWEVASRAIYDNDLDEWASSGYVHSDNVEEDIDRYRSVDNYEPIWMSKNYKKTDPAKVNISRHNGSLKIQSKRTYKISITYEELKRYIRDKKAIFMSMIYSQLYWITPGNF